MKLVVIESRPLPVPFEPQACTDHLGNVVNVEACSTFDNDDRLVLCRTLRDARERCATWERFAIDRLIDLLGK